MWTYTVRTSASPQSPREYYGYGWDVSEQCHRRIVHHDGTLPSFTSSYVRFVDSHTAIVVLTNADNAYSKNVALRVADRLFQDKTATVK